MVYNVYTIYGIAKSKIDIKNIEKYGEDLFSIFSMSLIYSH